MPHKISQQHTYLPHPSPAPSHHQTLILDQAERQDHLYPPSPSSPALHAESSPTASAASSALTSLISSPSSTPSPPLTSRCNSCHTPSLTGGLKSTPWHGPSMLKTVVTGWIEKHRLLWPKGAGWMNIETLVNWNKSTLDAIKVCAPFAPHTLINLQTGRSKEAHVDHASAQFELYKTRWWQSPSSSAQGMAFFPSN